MDNNAAIKQIIDETRNICSGTIETVKLCHD